jgi:hypothetical protein
MAPLRQRLLAWAVLSSHALVLALGTALMCAGREHTHGGIAAPDCAMHHRASAPADGADRHHHAHHDHAPATDEGSTGQQRIRCRCSADVLAAYLGEAAVLETGAAVPFVQMSTPARPWAVCVVENDCSPPSPPPR